MKRRNMTRKKRIKINKTRFFISMSIVIGLIFAITISAKALLDKKNSVDAISEKESSPKAKSKSDNKTIGFPEGNIAPALNKEKTIDKESSKKAYDKDDEVKDDINNIDKSVKTEQNANKSANVEKKINYKDIFKEDLFLGDSITDSLSFYDIVDEKNVIAKLGLTVVQAKEHINGIEKSKPSNVYIMFGMNDILSGIDAEKFRENYSELIHLIQKKSPSTQIYVQSALPISDKAKKLGLPDAKVDEFNESLIRMCNDEGITFIDIRPIIKENPDLYEPDGIHFKYDFYKLWLNYLIDNIQ